MAEDGEDNIQLRQKTSVDLDRDSQLDTMSLLESPKSRLRSSGRVAVPSTHEVLLSSVTPSKRSKSESAAAAEESGSPKTKKFNQAVPALRKSQRNRSLSSESQLPRNKLSAKSAAGSSKGEFSGKGPATPISSKNKNLEHAASAGPPTIKKVKHAAAVLEIETPQTTKDDTALENPLTKNSATGSSEHKNFEPTTTAQLFSRGNKKPKSSKYKIPMHSVLMGLIAPIKIAVRDGGYPADYEVEVTETDDELTLNAGASVKASSSSLQLLEPPNDNDEENNVTSAVFKDAGAAIRKALTLKEAASTAK